MPRLWPGATVVVAETGPSLAAADLARVRAAGLPTIAVNDAYKLAPWAEVLFAADAKWWRHHMPNLGSFRGLKVGMTDCIEFAEVRVPRHAGTFLDDAAIDFADPGLLFGNNSGCEATHFAGHATGPGGRVLLLGVDLAGTHFFGDHPGELYQEPKVQQGAHKTMALAFARLAPQLARLGVAVVNCSPVSALDCFPRQPLAEALAARAETAA